MRIFYTFFFVFFLFGVNSGQAPPFVWNHVIGGQFYDELHSISTNTNGDVYAAGHFSGTVDFDPGVSTLNLTGGGIFITKYDKDGNLLWANKTGGNSVRKILYSEEEDCLYIMGLYMGIVDFNPGTGIFNLDATTNGNIFLSKLKGDGEFIWAISFNAALPTFTIDRFSGDILVTGAFTDTTDIDPGENVHELISKGFNDITIFKLDNSGQLIWGTSLGGTYFDGATSIDVNSGNGDIFITGYFSITVDFDPDTAGEFNLTALSPFGATFILKLDRSGIFRWAKRIGGSGDMLFPMLKLDQTDMNNIYLAGSFNGNIDVDPDPVGMHNLSVGTNLWSAFILVMDNSGNFIRTSVLTTTNAEYRISSMVVDPKKSGDIFLAGYFSSTADFDPGPDTFNLKSKTLHYDVFLSRYHASGHLIWAKSLGGDGYDYSQEIVVDSSGGIYIGGYFASPSISFDDITLPNASVNETYDMFIAKTGMISISVPVVLHPDQVNLYPNPATDELRIEINEVELRQATITLFNNHGNVVSPNITQNGIHQATIDISKLIPGIYFIQFKIGKQICVKKFVKI